MFNVLIEIIYIPNNFRFIKAEVLRSGNAVYVIGMALFQKLWCHTLNPAKIDNAFVFVYRYTSYIHMHVLICWFV